jgi:hypothetical protein
MYNIQAMLCPADGGIVLLGYTWPVLSISVYRERDLFPLNIKTIVWFFFNSK